jgi:hypothetical protein
MAPNGSTVESWQRYNLAGVYEEICCHSMLRMLRPELRSSQRGNEPLRLRPESRAAQGRKETAEDHEELLEETEEGAEQNVQEQPEEEHLSYGAFLLTSDGLSGVVIQ